MAEAQETREYDINAKKLFQAVTQYEDYPKFVDGMKKVTISRPAGANEFTGDYEFSMMGKEMTYSLNLKEDPTANKLTWTLKDSAFFKVNNGKWTIEALGENKCRATYWAEVEFTFPVPGFMLKPMIKATLPKMMDSFAEVAKKL
ncbi:MAG: SRPBCC family protein [Bdellovibrionales bacterium]|nr:SRPBCC family protein [Bdellovibrionales bacterium]